MLVGVNVSMKRVWLAAMLLSAVNAWGQAAPATADHPENLVPAGFVVVEKVRGDLNRDDLDDVVLVIKATARTGHVFDEWHGWQDRNRRGLIIAFRDGDRFRKVLENRNCFSSENEDWGVYFPPELSLKIQARSLVIHYAHGRYGYWTYKFQFRNNDFEMIGYDAAEHQGPTLLSDLSVNFLTNQVRVRKNMAPPGDEKERLQETWAKLPLARPPKLRAAQDFDELQIEMMVERALKVRARRDPGGSPQSR
jgi:hypothetical protein